MSRSSHPRHPVNYSGGRWYGNTRAMMSQQAPSLGTARCKRSAFRSRKHNNSGWQECFGPARYSRSTWRLRLAPDDDDGLDGDHVRPQGVGVQILLACCAVVSALSLAVLAGCAAEYVLGRRAARREQEQLLAIVTARRAARTPSRPVGAAAPESGRGSPYRLDPTPPT